MEKLIRKILNYDAQNASKEQSEELCAVISAISMFLLDKTEKFNLPSNVDVLYSDDIRGGSSGKGLIKLYPDIFRNPDNFLNDISILAHENAHIAQRYFKDEKKVIHNEDALVCQSSHYYVLEYMIALNEFPELSDIIQNYGLVAAANFSSVLNKLHVYFKSFYELQSFEIEANDFSIEVIKYITKIGRTLNLNSTEKRNLQALEYGSKRVDNFYEMQNCMRMLRQDDSYAKDIKRFIANLRQHFSKIEPELIDAINNEKSFDIEENEWHQIIVFALCQSLEIDYDEKFARKIYNSMINSKQSVERDSDLFELALWTKLNLSKKEIAELENIYNNSSKKNESTPFSTLLKDKERLLKERESINTNKKLDICEFNFE